jgi:cell division protein FtsW
MTAKTHTISSATYSPLISTLRQYDGILVCIWLTLVIFGLVMVASASVEIAARHHGAPFYYLKRQLAFLAVAMIGVAVVLAIPLRFWQRYGWFLLIAALVLLTAVLIPGIGREVNGSRRWLALGPVNIQASELVKLAVVLYMAGYLVRHQMAVQQSWSGFIKPLLILGLLLVLLLLEPDFGSVVVILTTVMSLIFLAGAPLWRFILLITVATGGMALIAISQPYRLQRLITFTNPWADQFGSGYQLTQALIGFGRGEWFGLGLGNGIQKLFFLPEAHTDFLFSVIAEEFGVFGSLILLVLFVSLCARGLIIGYRAAKKGQLFAAYVAYGLALMIGLQALVNMGVNTGLLPTKGLTLPLLSYGGSSLVTSCLAIALLLRVAYETRLNTKPNN